MIGWALRYLGGAIAVCVLFGLLQDVDWRGWASSARVARSGPDLAGGTPRRDRGAGEAEMTTADLVVDAGPHGHFLLDVMVDGTPITFLIDTGASDVVLTLADARRLGFDPHRLDYSQRFQTANGEVRGAPVTLREVRVGQFHTYELSASVDEAPLGVSLLGMAFLRRLRGYEVVDGRLVLRW
jgi:clan AA aspartic protease (TIGR02281 family)